NAPRFCVVRIGPVYHLKFAGEWRIVEINLTRGRKTMAKIRRNDAPYYTQKIQTNVKPEPSEPAAEEKVTEEVPEEEPAREQETEQRTEPDKKPKEKKHSKGNIAYTVAMAVCLIVFL